MKKLLLGLSVSLLVANMNSCGNSDKKKERGEKQEETTSQDPKNAGKGPEGEDASGSNNKEPTSASSDKTDNQGNTSGTDGSSGSDAGSTAGTGGSSSADAGNTGSSTGTDDGKSGTSSGTGDSSKRDVRDHASILKSLKDKWVGACTSSTQEDVDHTGKKIILKGFSVSTLSFTDHFSVETKLYEKEGCKGKILIEDKYEYSLDGITNEKAGVMTLRLKNQLFTVSSDWVKAIALRTPEQEKDFRTHFANLPDDLGTIKEGDIVALKEEDLASLQFVLGKEGKHLWLNVNYKDPTTSKIIPNKLTELSHFVRKASTTEVAAPALAPVLSK